MARIMNPNAHFLNCVTNNVHVLLQVQIDKHLIMIKILSPTQICSLSCVLGGFTRGKNKYVQVIVIL